MAQCEGGRGNLLSPHLIVGVIRTRHHGAETIGMNALKALQEYGQSIWLDYLRRDLLTGGGLERLIAEDGLRGMTSNPSIFEKAIGGSTEYDAAIRELIAERDVDPAALF